MCGSANRDIPPSRCKTRRGVSIGEQASAGVAWTGVGKAVAQIAGFAATLALVRVLTPADFGLLAMVTVVTGFLAVVGELGFAAALIQREALEERHRSSVFWLNVMTGVALAALVFASAPAVARLYAEPRLSSIMRVLAIEFALAPFQMVQHALLSRDMKFRALAAAETAGVVVASAVALTMALCGFGVWALVGQTLAATVAEGIVLWLASSWRPRLIWDRAALGELLGFSGNLLAYSTISYWTSQLDDLLIGRTFGARALGLYGRAYSTMMMPVTEVGAALSRVMFPTFSKLQADPKQAKQMYLRILAVIGFVTFPVMFALAVLSAPFISVLFGEQWLGATTVLRIYCIVGASHALGSTTVWLYKAYGRTDWLLRWGIVGGTTTIAGIVIGVWLGSIESVAACYAVATVLVLGYPRFAIPGRLIGLRAWEVLRAVSGALVAASLMALGLLALGQMTTRWLSPAADFTVRAMLGGVLYLFLARTGRVAGLLELRAAVRARLFPDGTDPS